MTTTYSNSYYHYNAFSLIIYDISTQQTGITNKKLCFFLDDSKILPIFANPKGDVNGDSAVDKADLQLVVNYILKPFEDFNKDAADMNGDGKVNAADVVLIINTMANPE